ncbi:hypothetical protein [Candidatus Lokiarchaeum ossiferum]|uniref:hypothetical protein n=1 Tax=Candidatus Lokiarchaeum ossiferum TaxID=2951803 RepID=UPI00352EBDEC
MIPEMVFMQKKVSNKTPITSKTNNTSEENTIEDVFEEDQLAESLDHFGAVAGNLQKIIQSLSSTVERLEGKLHNLEKRIEETERKKDS